MKNNLAGLVFFTLLLNACSDEREKLKLRNLEKVRDCIKVINSEFAHNDFNFYYLKNDTVFIDNIPVVTVSGNEVADSTKWMKSNNSLKCIKELLNERITSGFKDANCDCFLYEYRELTEETFRNSRYIIWTEGRKDSSFETLLIEREILDRSGELILIGVKPRF